MGKEWFVFRNNHHWGPYTEEEMERHRRLGHLKESDLTWKEGQKDWRPLRDQEDLRGLLEEKERPEVNPAPSLQVEEVAPSEGRLPERGKKRFPFWRFGIVLGLGGMALLGYWYFFFLQPIHPPSFKGLDSGKRAEMEHILNSGEDIHHMNLSEDESGLWFAFGQRVEGKVSIYLTSREGEILAENPVEVFSSGDIYGGVGFFEEFEVLRGAGLVPGKYDYRIVIEPKNLMGHLVSFLKDYPIFEGQPWVQSLANEIKLTGVFYHYAESEEDFRERLALFNERTLFKRRGLPLIDQLEKLRVFYAMMVKVKEIFDGQLPLAKNGEDFGGLKSHYVEKVSPLLQRIVTDGHEKAVGLMESEVDLAREHLEIFEIGKKLAEFMGRTVEEITAVGEYTPEVRQEIQTKFAGEYDGILAELNGVLEEKKEKAHPFLNQEEVGPASVEQSVDEHQE